MKTRIALHDNKDSEKLHLNSKSDLIRKIWHYNPVVFGNNILMGFGKSIFQECIFEDRRCLLGLACCSQRESEDKKHHLFCWTLLMVWKCRGKMAKAERRTEKNHRNYTRNACASDFLSKKFCWNIGAVTVKIVNYVTFAGEMDIVESLVNSILLNYQLETVISVPSTFFFFGCSYFNMNITA